MHETKSKIQNAKFLKTLRVVGFIEGCSTLVLFFIAMPLKYIWGMPDAVSWPGRIHGGLFVLLVLLALIAIKQVPITYKLSFKIMVAAVIPFGPFVVDKELKALS
ncbi:MAG: DUF3817 domain-containing protein [Verrucomicrobiota bacterium]